MPYARTSTGYPIEMRAAVQKVYDLNQEMVIDCETEGMAKNLRGRYYQYLAACKRDAERPPAYWTEMERQVHNDFLRAFVTIEFYTKGTEFHIRPRDKSPLADTISRGRMIEDEAYAVPATEQSGTLSPAEESAARLQERLANLALSRKFTGEDDGK